MTSFATGLPNLPSCRAVELPIPPGRKCGPSQGKDVSRAGPQRIFHDFLAAELPSCRAANSAGPQMLGQSGEGCFRELGHCIFHDFLAAGSPKPPSINYAGQLMLAYKPHKMIQTT